MVSIVFLIAVHHVNHFVFFLPDDSPSGESSESLSRERSSMLNTVLTMENKEVRDDVVPTSFYSFYHHSSLTSL